MNRVMFARSQILKWHYLKPNLQPKQCKDLKKSCKANSETEFFYANKYDKECFVQGTLGECDFIEQELNYDKKIRIIDIGCGTGRHSIELTKRGYDVMGIDLSESQLVRAKEKAKQLNLKIDFYLIFLKFH